MTIPYTEAVKLFDRLHNKKAMIDSVKLDEALAVLQRAIPVMGAVEAETWSVNETIRAALRYKETP